MGFLRKEKKGNSGYKFDNYQPSNTMTMPVGGLIGEVNQALEKQERPVKEKIGFKEQMKLFGIRFSKLYVFGIAFGIFAYERFLQNKYNFITFVLCYFVAIRLAPTAFKKRGSKDKVFKKGDKRHG